MWVVPYEDLTIDQVEAVQLSAQQNRVIVGGPGSGKTLVLLHRAKRFLENGVPKEKIMILTYTKVLKSYLSESLNQLGIDSDIVTNIDKWTHDIFKQYVKSPRPMNENGKPDFERMRQKVLAVWEEEKPEPIFDLVVADEGQDLTFSGLSLLRIASRHVTVALDSRQDIFGTSTSVSKVCEALGVLRQSASLLSAYRCTPMIVNLASQFLPDGLKEEFRKSNIMEVHGAQKPLILLYENHDEQFDALVEGLNTAIFQGYSCAILSPNVQKMRTIEKEMEKRGVSCNVIDGNHPEAIADLVSSPIILNYQNAKGLTVDAVFMPFLEEEMFSAAHMQDEAQRGRLLFVGVTRAVKWAWLGAPLIGYLQTLEEVINPTRNLSAARNYEITTLAEINNKSKTIEKAKPTPNKTNLADLI